jgi:hypothetical protein
LEIEKEREPRSGHRAEKENQGGKSMETDDSRREQRYLWMESHSTAESSVPDRQTQVLLRQKADQCVL